MGIALLKSKWISGNLVFSEKVAGNGGAIHFGVSGSGIDVQFCGATANVGMLWDESNDELKFGSGSSIDITADKVMIDFKAGDASTINPSATAESGWINVNVGGVKRYIPFYAAS